MEFLSPPLFTTLRVNVLNHDIKKVCDELQILLNERYNSKLNLKVQQHSTLSDCLIIPSVIDDVVPCQKHVVVDYMCGMAVLRGASVYPPGILCAPLNLSRGDHVAVFVDLSKKLLKGSTKYDDLKLFLGNGISYVSRNDLFKPSKTPLKVNFAVEMTNPIFRSPSLNDVLTDKIFMQNLPSIIAGHVLGPQPTEVVIDMCAAPGGKSTHLFSLMKGEGRLVAIDRSKHKLAKIRSNFHKLFDDKFLGNVSILNIDSSTLIDIDVCTSNKIPYLYDRVLLDAPCSALGQRPRLYADTTVTDHVMSYPVLQRKLLRAAVRLLKVSGVLVYCTCTTTADEDEKMVEWALETFPCLRLVPQIPHFGSNGRKGVSSLTDDQLEMLQYFPTSKSTLIKDSILQIDNNLSQNDFDDLDASNLSCKDTIGFFIAKFIKVDIGVE